MCHSHTFSRWQDWNLNSGLLDKMSKPLICALNGIRNTVHILNVLFVLLHFSVLILPAN